MKKLFVAVALILVLTLALTAFVACNPEEDQPVNPPNDGDGTTPTDKITVSWYYGSQELKTEEIEKGAKATNWTPQAPENKEFTGWFKEASLTEPFDFEASLTEDTDIFAKFTSTEFEADENAYYLIGAGAGDMGKAAWDHTKAAANLSFTKKDVENANVYEITITMYAGDMFQICYGGGWDGQVGIGYVEGAEYCDGVNFYDNTEYTAADKKVAHVLIGGEEVFIGSDEYNKGFEVWNIKLAEGHDGVYKITYTTYPTHMGDNKITIELVEAIEPMTETHKMHLVGTFNGWAADDDTAEYAMKKSDDGKTWSAFLVVTDEMLEAGNVEFKVVNQIAGSWHSPDGNNITITEAGTYAVKFTVEGNVVEVAKCEYYLVGTFVDGEGAAVNFSVKEGVTPKLTVEGTTATCELVAINAAELVDYNWMTGQGKVTESDEPAQFAFQVVLGSELGIATWYGYNGDNCYITAGTYTVTFDIEAGTYTAVAA